MTSVSSLRNELAAPHGPTRRPKPMASLRDVADRAGVSLATASRVASGSSAVRPETRSASRARCATCSTSRPGRDRAVGRDRALRPRVLEPVFAALAEAMEMHAARSGLATILCNTHGSAGRERDYVRMLLERGVEGMVFISAEITDVRGRHSHYAQAARARRAARLRERRLRGPRRDVRRRRRACRRSDRDGAPDRARPRAHRLRRGARLRAADPREDARPPSTRFGRRS